MNRWRCDDITALATHIHTPDGSHDPDLGGGVAPFAVCDTCLPRDVTWAGTVRLGIDWVHAGFVATLFGACAALYAWAVLGTGTI